MPFVFPTPHHLMFLFVIINESLLTNVVTEKKESGLISNMRRSKLITDDASRFYTTYLAQWF